MAGEHQLFSECPPGDLEVSLGEAPAAGEPWMPELDQAPGVRFASPTRVVPEADQAQ